MRQAPTPFEDPARGIVALGCGPSELKLWLIDLSRYTEGSGDALLAVDERARAARFVFERDRQRYVAARSALREILAAATGLDAEALVFGYGPHGKPFLATDAAFQFNLTHSEDVAVVVIGAGAEVGVDVEVLRKVDDALALAAKHFTRSEHEYLESVPDEERARAFLTIWTRKEACLKAVGSGFSIPAASFEAGYGADAKVVYINADDQELPLGLKTLEAGSGRTLSVAWRLPRRARPSGAGVAAR